MRLGLASEPPCRHWAVASPPAASAQRRGGDEAVDGMGARAVVDEPVGRPGGLVGLASTEGDGQACV